jgi:hypothetical protein
MPRARAPSGNDLLRGVMRARDAARGLRDVAREARKRRVDVLADRARTVPLDIYNRLVAALLRLARGHHVGSTEARDILRGLRRAKGDNRP